MKVMETETIDFNQLKSLVNKVGTDRKIELINLLEKELFPIRFKKYLERIKTDEIDLDAIISEVSDVRANRYNAKSKN